VFEHTPRKRALALFLIILSLSSCQQNCRQWDFTKIPGECPPTTFARAYLPACSNLNGIAAEFLSIGGELHLFLNALLFEFPSSESDPCVSIVTVKINDTELEYPAERLDGGQRLMMPQEATETIVAALCEGLCVEVSVGSYRETLISTRFQETYTSYQKSL